MPFAIGIAVLRRRLGAVALAALGSLILQPARAAEAQGDPTVGAPSGDAAQPTGERASTPFERLWEKPAGLGFLPYRQSYLMFTHTGAPNSTPTSQNPVDSVTSSYPLQHTEVKFAFSLKSPVLPRELLGSGNALWFGYTQQSYWQAFDASHSRPFRESNYEPELIFSHRLNAGPVAGLHPELLNVGLVHQSNGQSDPRSRSWNRVYAQLGFVQRWSGEKSLALMLRPWWRVPESAANDNNPDIGHYLGHGDVECQYWHGQQLLTVLARSRALQVDYSTPLLLLDPRSPKEQSLQLHLQLFTGYGESLIDYNQRHTTLGVGFSVPYGR